jgi:3-methyladenine DNA glycosylase Mpg
VFEALVPIAGRAYMHDVDGWFVALQLHAGPDGLPAALLVLGKAAFKKQIR